MMFAYIRTVLVDIEGRVADVLEGLEQSRRWDLMKALEANLDGLDQALAKVEADFHLQDAKAIKREQELKDEAGVLRLEVEELKAKLAVQVQALEVSQAVVAEG